jgi:hypothetical protein
MKTFSLDEARTLLPVLESLLKRAVDGKQTAESIEGDLQALNQRIFVSGGMMVQVAEVAKQRVQRDRAIQQAKDAVAEIDSAGVQVKDLDKGLLDFPYRLGGETVLLCWKMGEKDISYWHSTEEGFRGRKPLDARFGGGKPHAGPAEGSDSEIKPN